MTGSAENFDRFIGPVLSWVGRRGSGYRTSRVLDRGDELHPPGAARTAQHVQGVARVVFFVPSATADTVLPLLDGYAAVAKKVG